MPGAPHHAIDADRQRAYAGWLASDKAFAIRATRRKLSSMVRHFTHYITKSCGGQEATEVIEAFFSTASGLRELLGCVVWRGSSQLESKLVSALQALQTCLGWFSETDPTVEAMTIHMFSHGSLSWLPLVWAKRMSGGKHPSGTPLFE